MALKFVTEGEILKGDCLDNRKEVYFSGVAVYCGVERLWMNSVRATI